MWLQEKMVPASEEAREAYIRHWLRYREDFVHAFPPSAGNEGDAGTASIPSPLAYPGKALRPILPIALAAMVILPLLIWLLAPMSRNEPPVTQLTDQVMEVAVRNGEKQHLVLPDGSQVWLNAGSTLQYYAETFSGPRREVTLSGEAYFDIAHDEQRPFLVKSGHLQIRVLGTAFNVKAYPGEKEIETSLIRGAVEIKLDNRPKDVYILRPNEKLVVSNQSPASVQQVAARESQTEESVPLISLRQITVADSGRLVHETAWVQNMLVFRAESFASLAPRLERWYGVKFHFRNQGREALTFTGIFTTETISQALQAMQLVQPFEFIQENENIYIQ
jgi:ferric-dicitrate binding protein FerR (iron transport regulator)